MSGTFLVRAVFGLLVVATAGAFFFTQRLKRAEPVVERVWFADHFSPNGDGREDTVDLRFDLPEDDRVTVEIVDETGEPVRELADDVPRGADRGGVRWTGPGERTARLTWDGRTDAGRAAPDGVYRMRVTLREEGRLLTAPRELRLDTTAPRPRIVEVSPPTIVPTLDADEPRGRVRIRLERGHDPEPVFQVYRTDAGEPRLMRTFKGPRFRKTAIWDGRDESGEPVPDGVYAFRVTVQDAAGNEGSAPAAKPPTAESTPERTGVEARYLTASGPLVPVEAGRTARIQVGPIPRRVRWTLSRLGSARAIARGGEERGREFAIRVPRDARTGLHLLRVRAGGHRGIVPIAVDGRRSAKVLVVLPAITWQGRNPLDDDRDGFPDTLDSAGSVLVERGFAHARLPEGLESRVAPILRFLDEQRLRYDLTTDLALARGQGPQLDGRTGLLFPGSERWLTEDLDRRLREYVEGGGRVASFGVDSFRRRVRLAGDALAEPSAPELRNVFGEEVAKVSVPEAPLTVTSDSIAMFDRTDGFVGLFERLELSRSLAAGLELVAAAGRDAEHPAFVVYRLGDGLVLRAGAPGWARQLEPGSEIARVTERTWKLLSR